MSNSSSSSKVQLLYSKAKVYVHASASHKDYIPGFLALVRPKDATDSDVLLAWIPESIIQLEDYNSYVKVDMDMEADSVYTPACSSEVYVSRPVTLSSISNSYAFSIPLRNLCSVQARSPSIWRWWGSIVLHTRTEETLPSLFFHDSESESSAMMQDQLYNDFDPFGGMGGLATSTFLGTVWGGTQFLKVLETYCVVKPSATDSSILLVNPGPDDDAARDLDPDTAAAAPEDMLGKALDKAKWTVLENMARLTRMTMRASQGVLDNAPPSIRTLLNQPEVKRIGDEFGAAKFYLAKWAMGIAEEAERGSNRRIVWEDGVPKPGSTSESETDAIEYTGFLSSYHDTLDTGFEFELLSLDFEVERRVEVSEKEWASFFDKKGSLVAGMAEDEIKDRVFHGGLAPSIRSEAWLFLLGVYPWTSTAAERREILKNKRDEYYRLKRQWWEDSERQQTDEFWKDQKWRIEKDVYRTDRTVPLFEDTDTPHPDGPQSRFAAVGTNLHLEQMKDMLITYNEYNQNLGYVQGMSDLLSPLYVVFQDDAVAYCGFCAFMARMERNFLRDQSGMRDQMLVLEALIRFMDPELHDHLDRADSTNLFFFFRMLLVWYKREFEWDKVLRLWEVLWTDWLSSQFVLFIALAILDKHKQVMLARLNHFDEILRYMNDLAMNIELEDVLVRAEVLFQKFKQKVGLIDRRREAQMTSLSSLSSSSPSMQASNLELLPFIPDNLRQLLSRDVIIVRESKRPPNVGGG